jgi:hypothetical protein
MHARQWCRAVRVLIAVPVPMPVHLHTCGKVLRRRARAPSRCLPRYLGVGSRRRSRFGSLAPAAWGWAVGGDVADDEEAEAEMARKREWVEWLEK